MSAISLSIPHPGTATEIVTPELSAGDLAGYRFSMSKENAARKSLLPVNLNSLAKVWMPHDIRIPSDSEYVYAIFTIALALFLDKGVREIATSKPLSMEFTILSHCLNKPDFDNYFLEPTDNGLVLTQC